MKKFVFVLYAFFAAASGVLACSDSSSPSSSPVDAGQGDASLGAPCTLDGQCASGLCLSTGDGGGPNVCSTTCQATSDCVAGWSCGKTPNGTSACQCTYSPEICDGKDNDCDGVVDNPLQTDRACVARHGAGYTCVSGDCTCSHDNFCHGACRDLTTDPKNCGKCDTVCTHGATCTAGACTCSGGGTLCGGSCVPTASDANNCGGCGKVCPTRAACQAGKCVCPDGFDVCGNECVDERTDPKHCGDCNTVCALGAVCTNANCYCPFSGRTLCGNVCTNTDVDVRNCGKCNNACASGVCMTGLCAPVITQISSSSGPGIAMAVDATTVYWGTQSAVYKAPLGGGQATSLTSANVVDLALDSARVYFIAAAGATGAIRAVPIGGGTVVTLASAQSNPTRLATDGTSVFWVNSGDGTINSVPVAGGTITALATNQKVNGWGPWAIALSGANVYWTVPQGLRSTPKSGGSVTNLVTGDNSIINQGWITADAQNVYYAVPSGIKQEALSGGSPLLIAQGFNGGPQGQLGLDASYLWVSPYDGTILRVPIGGGTAIPILDRGQSLQTLPWTVTADSTNIYWVDYAGNVWKATKP